MRSGIELTLVEDVPESGGQNCIWAAGLVMARYLEDPGVSGCIRGRRVLELGAGCGLTSMVAAALGAEVYSTEQDSCLPYLEYNLALNPGINVQSRRLHWTHGFDAERFDVILGCDITYDISWIDGILETFDKCLTEKGSCFVCHDDDSCPMSPEAVKRFLQAAALARFEVAEVNFRSTVEEAFGSQTVRMWRLTRLHSEMTAKCNV
jgi:predicted nicotinamide N-methyase